MAQQKKTLLIFSPAFPAGENDNWLPWLQNTVLSVNKNFPHVELVIFTFKYPVQAKAYTWHGNRVIPFGQKKTNKLNLLLSWGKIINRFLKIKKSANIAGILSVWCGECAYVAARCAALGKVKHFSWIVGQDARAANKYVKKIRPQAVTLVAMSDFLQEEFYRNHNIFPLHLVPTGIAPEQYHAHNGQRTIDVLGAGSLCVLKQYDIFIDVVAALQKQLPLLKATLCGGGEESANLVHKAAALQVTANISFTGEVPHAAIIEHMQQCRIFLHPSSYEGFSNVCLEALYAGAHVISFTQPMNENIRNWHIVRTKEEMIAKALELLTDTTIIYEKVLYHTFDTTAKKLVQLFGE